MPRLLLALALMSIAGCAGSRQLAMQSAPGELNADSRTTNPRQAAVAALSPVSSVASDASFLDRRTAAAAKNGTPSAIQLVGHNTAVQAQAAPAQTPADMLTIDGRQYRLQPVEPKRNGHRVINAAHSTVLVQDEAGYSTIANETAPSTLLPGTPYSNPLSSALPANTVNLNLPSALAMIDGQHPAVGFAQWRVQEAYAQLASAKVLWLPSIQAGFSFHHHDGNYQASNGGLVDVNRSSFQYGLGTGATGAGTTPLPGLVAQFHLADAIFQPAIAEKTAWARSHAAKAVLNEQLLDAALAYIELLDAHQDSRILEDSRDRTAKLSKITSDYAEAGEGLQSDADRMLTELSLLDNRLIAARERIAVAAARLAQAISLEADCQILPTDITAVPLDLVDVHFDKASLVSTGLTTRPELMESQALVAAACEAFKREKYAPFVPSVLLGFSNSGFGGGLGGDIANVRDRSDFDAQMSWQVRNLGFSERAARRESSARYQQAKYEKLRIMDQVARQVSEAYSQVEFRRQQMAITQQAIQTAEQSYRSNSERILDGEGLPIEVLQSVQALEAARRAYLRAIIDHNQAQFQLQWALGWPVNVPDEQLAVTG